MKKKQSDWSRMSELEETLAMPHISNKDIDLSAKRNFLPSTVATRRQQGVCVRRAYKSYGSKKNLNLILDSLDMTVPKGSIPTKFGGMLNVKSQMSGWLGNAAIPTMQSMPAMPSMSSIPGFRKGTTSTDEGATNEALAISPENVGDAGNVGAVDEEDRSRYSATEGADSAPGSGPGTPSDEKGGQVGMVTTKVTQGAKNFGSFLNSAVNKAGAKIKETVKDNSILGEFSKEQAAFIKGQQGNADAAVAPWIGHQNKEKVKEEILGLSSDRRNFVRAPPAGVDFDFNYDISYSIAVAIMGEDAALEKMRFELVPKIITEQNFWRNYFYRVSLICQAGDLGTLGIHGGDDEDTFQTNDKDLEEVKAGMKKLGIDTLGPQAGKDA